MPERERNIPTHRWYQRRFHTRLAQADYSQEWIYPSGIVRINEQVGASGALDANGLTPSGVYNAEYGGMILIDALAKDFDDLFSADETWGLGTMIDESGVHVFNPHNAYTDAEDVNQWGISTLSVTSDAGTAPDGTVTADLIENTTTADECGTSIGAMTSWRGGCGVFVKPVTAGFFKVTQGSGEAWIDLATGDASYVGNTITATVTALPDGWFHVYTTFTVAVASIDPLYRIVDALGSDVTTVGEQAYLWGAHVSRIDLGGVADDPNPAVAAIPKYIKTSGAPRFFPRQNHYVAGVRGFLIEPDGATNLLTQSDDISHADWTLTANTTTGAVTTIRGIDLTRLTNNSTSTFRSVSQGAVTLVDDDILTISAFISGGNSENLLQMKDGGGTQRTGLYLNWSGGVPIFQSTSVNSSFELMGYGIEDMGDGLYRAWVSGRNISGANLTGIKLSYFVSRSAPAAAGDEYLDLGGLQMEKSEVVTSYIPTPASAVSRGAETITVPADVMDSLGLLNAAPITGTNLWPTSPSNITQWVDNLDGTYTKTAGVFGAISENLVTLTDNGAYEFTFTIAGRTAGEVFARSADSGGLSASNNSSIAYDADGTYTVVIGVQDSNDFLGFFGDASFDGTVSNVTIREVHRRGIGVHMEGGISYAEIGDAVTATFFRLYRDIDNHLLAYLTTSGLTGTVKGYQKYAGTGSTTGALADEYVAGFNTAFNIAATFEDARVNAAQNGVVANNYVSVAALPDLVGVDMRVAYTGPAYHLTKFEIFGENTPASDGDFKMDTVFLTEVTS